MGVDWRLLLAELFVLNANFAKQNQSAVRVRTKESEREGRESEEGERRVDAVQTMALH